MSNTTWWLVHTQQRAVFLLWYVCAVTIVLDSFTELPSIAVTIK